MQVALDVAQLVARADGGDRGIDRVGRQEVRGRAVVQRVLVEHESGDDELARLGDVVTTERTNGQTDPIM